MNQPHHHGRFVASCMALVFAAGVYAEPTPAGIWHFDGDLGDDSGCRNRAYAATAQFVDGQSGTALHPERQGALVSDSPELRLAPGLRVECWVRFADIPPGGREVVMKSNEYMLRVDPDREGSHFSFFIYLDGWEPRVQSPVVPEVGRWHHLVAGWDGQELFLTVDGRTARRKRTGQPRTAYGQLRFGPLPGDIDELRVLNSRAAVAGEARWSFDGHLRDDSGHGHDGAAEDVRFADGVLSRALAPVGQGVRVPDDTALRIAPGFHLDCRVYFDTVPAGIQTIVAKEGEWMLRVDPPREGSDLAFFVNLDGWEPRVRTNAPVEPGKWYRILAHWNGVSLALEVDGVQTRISRSGLCRPGTAPLIIGGPNMRVDEVRIDNPKRPAVRIGHVSQQHAVMRAGAAETLSAVIQNLSQPVDGASVRLLLPAGVRCQNSPLRQLGHMATGEKRTIQWRVTADKETSGVAEVRLTARDAPMAMVQRPLAFFPRDDTAIAQRARPSCRGGATYYIDSRAGSNDNSGQSPESPWRDFTNINGKTLGPGDRLLLRRGSVFTHELSLSARGVADNWARIGAYGSGPRPIIRGNWDIDDRCVLLLDPDYLHVSSLVVCYAGKGLVAHYRQPGHAGLLIENCIAHHIEGLYRTNANGIPEWLDRHGARGDGLHSSAGFGVSGASASDIVIRDCEMFQTSWGFFVRGDGVILDRLYCHDNYVRNTSPHPALVAVRRSYLLNSVFDAPGWHASAGTMGIMLGDPQGLIIRNCTWRNQPDSGSHDEGGIDFENSGNGCLIDHCTFQNNAGAAIEVLGLRAPQTRNVEIAHSRFLLNNTAHKLGPAEIYIWGKSSNPDICCSTGTIHDNGYVTVPGVKFFVNEAPKTTLWTLRNNTSYATVEEADRAMPFNAPPTVDAGAEIFTDESTVHLSGVVTDDHRAGTQPLGMRWEVIEGPGAVTFSNPAAPATEARLSAPGHYLLRLVADDGELWLSHMTTVHILPRGVTVAKAWEFNHPLDKEGWTDHELGTKVRHWQRGQWSTTSHPVHYVAGGYYILAIENSSTAHLLSADDLDIDITRHKKLRLRLQHHTPANRMRVRFTTRAQPDWHEANSKVFAVAPDEESPRDYVVDLSDVSGWSGILKQLRLDLSDGLTTTGTCRIDYIWVTS